MPNLNQAIEDEIRDELYTELSTEWKLRKPYGGTLKLTSRPSYKGARTRKLSPPSFPVSMPPVTETPPPPPPSQQYAAVGPTPQQRAAQFGGEHVDARTQRDIDRGRVAYLEKNAVQPLPENWSLPGAFPETQVQPLAGAAGGGLQQGKTFESQSTGTTTWSSNASVGKGQVQQQRSQQGSTDSGCGCAVM